MTRLCTLFTGLTIASALVLSGAPALAQAPATRQRREEIRARTGASTLILSAERLDYVKGVLERLGCFERFLERHPERHGDVSFVQIAVPTRTGMEEFQSMRRLTEEAVGRINGRFGTMDWQPVIHFYGTFDREELVAFYTAADVAWVTPLRDGLNLVVKEYIACSLGGDGVVILSEFAGAAAELSGVILTNPYSPDDMDRALDGATPVHARVPARRRPPGRAGRARSHCGRDRPRADRAAVDVRHRRRTRLRRARHPHDRLRPRPGALRPHEHRAPAARPGPGSVRDLSAPGPRPV